jgi:hypothetical protein
VPPLSLLLYRTLAAMDRDNHVKAVDLTTNPYTLLTRTEYLAANRHLIQSGGSIQRIFICHTASLLEADFVKGLLQVVDRHRGAGVECGLAIRESVRPDDAIDAVVFGRAAVLVEHAQANTEYTSGWSAVYFKRVDAWSARFARLWQRNESPAAPVLLASFEAVVRPMLIIGSWNPDSIRAALDLATVV